MELVGLYCYIFSVSTISLSPKPANPSAAFVLRVFATKPTLRKNHYECIGHLFTLVWLNFACRVIVMSPQHMRNERESFMCRLKCDT